MAKVPESLIDTPPPRSKAAGLAVGIGVGIFAELVAVFLAFISAGSGHGDYAFARLLFPLPLLFMPLEGGMGVMTLSTGALQFPLYGAFISWIAERRSYAYLAALAFLHLAAAIACFTGALSQFT